MTVFLVPLFLFFIYIFSKLATTLFIHLVYNIIHFILGMACQSTNVSTWCGCLQLQSKVKYATITLDLFSSLEVMRAPLLLHQTKLTHQGSIKHCTIQHCQLFSDITPCSEQRLWALDKILLISEAPSKRKMK